MSKISPSPTDLIEQRPHSDLKQPFLGVEGGFAPTSGTLSDHHNQYHQQTRGKSAFSKPAESTHTIPFTPVPPTSQSKLNSKTLDMAVSEDIAIATASTAANTNNSDQSLSHFKSDADSQAVESLKPVVTPEASRPADKTQDNAVCKTPEPSESAESSSEDDSPQTPPRVTSVAAKGDLGHPEFSPPQGLVTANRARILSLDRAKDTINASILADANTEANDSKNDDGDDDDEDDDDDDDNEKDNSSHADSSDGESSYFAKHLPSPKSGRRFSYSSSHSQHSAPARTSVAGKSSFYKATSKPSDASLSFSDDESDDEELPRHATESPEPVCPLPSQVADMQLQRITRVHSVSSLVSSNDDEEDHESRAKSPQSTLSKDSSGTTSDQSVSAELQTVVASSKQRNDRSFSFQMVPSGRRSPLPPNAAFMGYYNTSPASTFANPSPPTIVPGYNVAGMPHPQPQVMTQDQLTAWMAAGNLVAAHQHQQKMLGGSKSASDGAIPFVYSDDETDDTPFLNQFATQGSYDVYDTFQSGAGRGGGGNRGSSTGDRGGSGEVGSGTNNGQEGYGTQQSGTGVMARENSGENYSDVESEGHPDDVVYKVYLRRWIMLFYMSGLNLLSDWTCYSVAPIAILTKETFGNVDPERLVTIFLGANAIASACEPIILARLGLRKTVLCGSFFLMLGSMIKCGGLPPFIQGELVKGRDEWRLSLGFFLVGLSQPLYQCTPALLSASWFPEKERTMATGVALNSNQLGIGCAFIFGTLLVVESDDIPSYFSLLSILATIMFLGTLMQFDDAPPTPPSGTAKVMRGDLNIPDVNSIVQSVRKMNIPGTTPPPAAVANKVDADLVADSNTRQRKGKSSKKKDGITRRRKSQSPAPAPSPALSGKTRELLADPLFDTYASAPSPMMPGPTQEEDQRDGGDSPLYDEGGYPSQNMQQGGFPGGYPMYPPGMPYGMPPPGPGQYGSLPPPNPYYDPRMMQQPPDPRMMQQAYGSQYGQQPYFYPPPPHPYYYGYQNGPPMYPPPPNYYHGAEAYSGEFDEGAEPVVTISDHKLDINIRDDQVILSTRLCLSRPGFIHALVAFTVSAIVVNTLSTFMDYLVRLNGAGREYVGIVGGSFQIIIMISSLIIGKQTDKTRAYYSVIIAMLVLGAFGLAECGVSLDADRGSDLRWSLLVVAALVGPLQPVSTELGVDVAYPLSENTVLVIQQLFANLLSALFIPFFKSLKDVGITNLDDNREQPQYTFSFYLLIVLHAGATVFFATFNGRYLRYEHELEKEAAKEQRRITREQAATAFYPVQGSGGSFGDSYSNSNDDPTETQPLTGQRQPSLQ